MLYRHLITFFTERIILCGLWSFESFCVRAEAQVYYMKKIAANEKYTLHQLVIAINTQLRYSTIMVY